MKMILFEQHIKTVIAIAIIYLMATDKLFAQMPKHDWAKNVVTNSSGKSIVCDQHNNVYICGGFSNTVDFDPGVGVYNYTTITGAYVTKYDNNGNFLWVKIFERKNPDLNNVGGVSPQKMTIDSFGHIIIVGAFTDTVDFDPSSNVLNFNNPSFQWNQGFMVKLDTSGAFIFAKQFEGFAYPHDVACDKAGNIITTGQLMGMVDFDPGPATFNLNSLYGTEIFISKLDSNGNFVWAKQMKKSGSNLYEGGFGIGVDADDNIYTTGTFEDSTDFDPGPNVYQLSSIGSSAGHIDAFVSKLDKNGNFIWAKQFGKKNYFDDPETSLVFGRDLTIDKNNNVIATGWYSIKADFDPGPNETLLKITGSPATYICKLDKNGNFIWAKQFDSYLSNTGGLNMPFSITSDDCNNIYTIGEFFQTIDMDPSSNEFLLTINADHSDAIPMPQVSYMSKLNEDGNFIWAGKLDGEAVFDWDISLDKQHNIFTTGMFYNLADFDPNNEDTSCLISKGADAFIHKLNQDCAIDTNISINNFTVTVAQLNASYQWINCTTGNAIAGANNQSFTATENGNYAVMITLNECCHATSNCIAIKNIGVVPHGSLFVPNAFSPNGDGVNPTFIPIINGQIKTDGYKMMVFNRWGNQVFTSNDISKGWDGLQHGMPCEMGTYFYYIECQTLDNQKLIYKGDVTLLK
jgi:gliding motility-associated-like protein